MILCRVGTVRRMPHSPGAIARGRLGQAAAMSVEALMEALMNEWTRGGLPGTEACSNHPIRVGYRP
jgi:hypothetical protein